jgi:hypothetical protein
VPRSTVAVGPCSRVPLELTQPEPSLLDWSGRTMARSGLRMMPAFPSSPLKFRTASFPRYGFKASLSGRAALHSDAVKPAPGIPASRFSLHRPFARIGYGIPRQALSPGRSAPPHAAVREARASLPQGSLAPVRVMLSRSIIA